MNPFERHGIAMLSASSIALYRAEPAFWVLRHLYRVKDNAGPSAWRGRAVEAGVDHVLFEGCDDDAAVEFATAAFEIDACGDLSDDVDKNRQVVPDMVRQATALLRPFGHPVSRQFKIEHWIDGIEVPIIGWGDYRWETHLVDLKTTLRMPSEPDPDHQAQVTLYSDATGLAPGLAYASDKKRALYRYLAIDTTTARRALVLGARAIRAMLSKVDDKEEAALMFSPKPDDYHWNEETILAAKEIWK